MRTYPATRLILATAAFGVLASFAHAGPPPEGWSRSHPITTVKEAEAIKPADTVIMGCRDCKTVMVREPSHLGPPSKGQGFWLTIGSKHKCAQCSGEITVVRGKTTNSMQFDCSKCGEDAAYCCVVSAMSPKK